MVETRQYLVSDCWELQISPVKQQPHASRPFPPPALSTHEPLHLHKARTQVQGLCLRRTKIGPAAPSRLPTNAAAAGAPRRPPPPPGPGAPRPLLPGPRWPRARGRRSGPRLPPGYVSPGRAAAGPMAAAGAAALLPRRRRRRHRGAAGSSRRRQLSAREAAAGRLSYDRPPAAPALSRATRPPRPRSRTAGRPHRRRRRDGPAAAAAAPGCALSRRPRSAAARAAAAAAAASWPRPYSRSSSTRRAAAAAAARRRRRPRAGLPGKDPPSGKGAPGTKRARPGLAGRRRRREGGGAGPPREVRSPSPAPAPGLALVDARPRRGLKPLGPGKPPPSLAPALGPFLPSELSAVPEAPGARGGCGRGALARTGAPSRPDRLGAPAGAAVILRAAPAYCVRDSILKLGRSNSHEQTSFFFLALYAKLSSG